MPRRSKQEELTTALHAYLATAEKQTPEEYPLDRRSVAKALGVSPTTLYKYQLQEYISAAEQHQREMPSQTSKNPRYNASKERLQKLEETVKQAEERNKHLVARLALVEANAARLGIDPEELYRPVMRPVRTVSHAGKRGASASKRG
jgi:predicted RNase H-like nuclease (RuvC/YqgF family)